MTTTTTPITAADPHTHVWAENARIYELHRAMCAWRVDPVGGRTRLVRDITCKHGATDREITRARPTCASAGTFPPARSSIRTCRAIVKELHAYKATADHLFSVVLGRFFDEARFLRLNGGKAAKTHPKARALRAWWRNAERMQRK
jgi:hypothetical protein